jgi:copper homeostasis protein (lipoprotein)
MRDFLQKTILVSFALVILVFSCTSGRSPKQPEIQAVESKVIVLPDHHSSRASLDWHGVYRGVIPCADCEGIEIRIVLHTDGSFQRRMKYLGRDDKVLTEEGQFEWDESGKKITLKGEAGEQQYLVGENVLFHLDLEGNRITGGLEEKYRLNKNKVDPELEGNKWVLKELMGKPVVIVQGQRQGYIEFSMEAGKFTGNNTCNDFFGQYELLGGNRIRFGAAGTTLRACPDMEIQNQFMEILQMTDNYLVVENMLSLNRARMAPLARFRGEERQ